MRRPTKGYEWCKPRPRCKYCREYAEDCECERGPRSMEQETPKRRAILPIEVADQLSQIFGYGDRQCRSIRIDIEPNTLITATIELVCDEGMLTQVLELGSWEPPDEA